jgi:hypothetical protein
MLLVFKQSYFSFIHELHKKIPLLADGSVESGHYYLFSAMHVRDKLSLHT